jgi:uncharacterized membrane protein YeaQ/YmgE (transglycosylase-associated protein family)
MPFSERAFLIQAVIGAIVAVTLLEVIAPARRIR